MSKAEKLKEKELKLIEELKKDFDGTTDYLSGANDGMYHLARKSQLNDYTYSQEQRAEKAEESSDKYLKKYTELAQENKDLIELFKRIEQMAKYSKKSSLKTHLTALLKEHLNNE